MEVTINDFVRYRKLKQECARLGRQITKLEESNGKQVADKATGSSPYFPYTETHIPIVGLLHNTARINAKKDQLAEMEAEANTAPPAPTPEQESAAALKEIRDLLAEMKEQSK